MKWAKTTLELKDDNPQGNDRAECFREYDEINIEAEPNKPKKAIGKRNGQPDKELYEWITHNNLRPLKKKGRRKYEAFVGGFLFFHEKELQKYPQKIVDEYPLKFNGEQFGTECYDKLQKFFKKVGIGVDHEIYFEWGNEKIAQDKKMYVTIYINPPAGNPEPPTPPPPPPPEMND